MVARVVIQASAVPNILRLNKYKPIRVRGTEKKISKILLVKFCSLNPNVTKIGMRTN